MSIVLNVIFALPERIPEFDCPVAGARNDLPVVGREADGEDIGGVADETAGGEAGVQVPQAEGVVPGRGEGELAVRGDDDVRNEVVVAAKNAFWVTVRVLVARQLPDNDGFVCAGSFRGC